MKHLFVTLQQYTSARMKKSSILAVATLTGFLLLTTSASAQVVQAQAGFTTLGILIKSFNDNIVKSVGTLFMSLAVIAFFWGIVQYIWGLREGNAKKVQDGNQVMIWGIVSLFVMFSIYGIIKLLQIWFGLNGSNVITIPEINIRSFLY